MNGYALRDVNLLTMGYTDYGSYLKGELWSGIRKRAYATNGDRCKICKKAAEVIHHQSYELAVLKGEDLAPLKPLCHICHDLVEIDGDGKKRTFHQATLEYWRLCPADKPERKHKGIKARTRKKKGRLYAFCMRCPNKCPLDQRYCKTCQSQPGFLEDQPGDVVGGKCPKPKKKKGEGRPWIGKRYRDRHLARKKQR